MIFFCNFRGKDIGTKAAYEMSVKLIEGQPFWIFWWKHSVWYSWPSGIYLPIINLWATTYAVDQALQWLFTTRQGNFLSKTNYGKNSHTVFCFVIVVQLFQIVHEIVRNNIKVFLLQYRIPTLLKYTTATNIF